MNLFVRPVDEYNRNIDVLSAYYRDMATGLSRVTQRSYEECLDYVKRVTGPGGRLEFSDPPMKFVGRNDNGDRQLMQTTFLGYLNTVAKNTLIMSPSMTVYQNPDVMRSVTAQYIGENIKKRSASKKAMFKAREEKNMELFAFKNNEQQTSKIKNNALSGAHCSKSTVLYLDTIHSSLTSTCRSASGYGNANNEKVISGNRHYWSPEITIANILSIVTHADLPALEQMMQHHGLRAPTAEEAMECIQYSTDFYWRGERHMSKVRRLIHSLTPIELSAVVYVGDLYHIAKYNDAVVRKMLDRLSDVSTEQVENPKQYLQGITEEMASLVSLLCGNLMDGKSLAKFDEFDATTQNTIGATAKNVSETLTEYADFIKVIFVSEVIPASVASLPTIVRRCAITSDTDSTIFTVQDWLQWYSGEMGFDQKSTNVGHVVAFFASSSITHILAKMSANMGVRKSQLHQYAMKSEFYFPVFALTSRAKTYFASIGAQEGQVFSEVDREVKGAVLKGSQSPKFIMDGVKKLLNEILDTVHRGEKIKLTPILNHISAIEHQIYDAIQSGSVEFFKRGEIKQSDSYKASELQSPYFQYLLWENVFAAKYGHAGEPPYASVKVSLDIANNTDFEKWLASFEDAGLRERLVEFLKESGKKVLSTIQVPKIVIDTKGVPPEIIGGVSIRRIIANLMEPYYVLLESLGYYSIEDNQLRLVSDTYNPNTLTL